MSGNPEWAIAEEVGNGPGSRFGFGGFRNGWFRFANSDSGFWIGIVRYVVALRGEEKSLPRGGAGGQADDLAAVIDARSRNQNGTAGQLNQIIEVMHLAVRVKESVFALG